MDFKRLNKTDKDSFDRDGYVLIPSLFSEEEVALLYQTARNDTVLSRQTYDRGDKEGLRTRLALWYSLGDDIYSLLASSERILSGVELLLEGEPAHFHSKLMQKEPRVGGAWEWHQDYGYWYKDGFMFPYMLSVMTAFTPSTRENGCLQVLRGSHKMGRVEHGLTGEQKGADQEVVKEAMKRLELVYVEMEPGDTLFFHSNVLHRSDSNRSDEPRWSIISAYNRTDNKPYKGNYEYSYMPAEKRPDHLILENKAGGISADADFNKKNG